MRWCWWGTALLLLPPSIHPSIHPSILYMEGERERGRNNRGQDIKNMLKGRYCLFQFRPFFSFAGHTHTHTHTHTQRERETCSYSHNEIHHTNHKAGPATVPKRRRDREYDVLYTVHSVSIRLNRVNTISLINTCCLKLTDERREEERRNFKS